MTTASEYRHLPGGDRDYPFALCAFLVLLASSASAENTTRTGWSGSPVVWGPVTGFGDDFYSDSGIECHPSGGGIRFDLVDQLIGHLVVEDCVLVTMVRAADIDLDGDIDLVSAGYGEDELSWWENLDGSGESWVKHLAYGGFAGASSVCVADIDSDGILDFAATGREENRLVWWDVLTYPPEGWLTSSVLDVSCWPDWGMLDWNADVPPGTSVAFQVRSSSSPDSASFGPWSDTLSAPCSL